MNLSLVAIFSYLVHMIEVVPKYIVNYLQNHSIWLLRWDIFLSLLTVGVEITSAAIEQINPNKLKIAEWGVIIAAIALMLSLADIVYRYKYERTTFGNNHNQRNMNWGFADVFGLVFSVLTSVSASLHYGYLRNNKQQPIRFSMVPLAFSICVLCSRIFRPDSKLKFVMRCDHMDLMELVIEPGGGGVLYGNKGPTRFSCCLCPRGLPHPEGV